jgi:hypothetical protein
MKDDMEEPDQVEITPDIKAIATAAYDAEEHEAFRYALERCRDLLKMPPHASLRAVPIELLIYIRKHDKERYRTVP